MRRKQAAVRRGSLPGRGPPATCQQQARGPSKHWLYPGRGPLPAANLHGGVDLQCAGGGAGVHEARGVLGDPRGLQGGSLEGSGILSVRMPIDKASWWAPLNLGGMAQLHGRPTGSSWKQTEGEVHQACSSPWA